MRKTPTVYLIDDDVSFAKALENYTSSLGIRVARIASADEFLSQSAIEHPSCVIIDLSKHFLAPDRLLSELAQSRLASPMIALADADSLAAMVRAARDGAVAFLEKGRFGRDEIVEAIQVALKIDTQRSQEQAERDDFQRCLISLSPREREILEFLWKGNEVAAIATALNLSRRTIDKHRESLMRKLKVQSFPEFIALFARFGESPTSE